MELYEGICHEVRDDRLLELLQNKSSEMKISLKDVMWMYINRGILEDSIGDDVLFELHSEEYMSKVNEALGID